MELYEANDLLASNRELIMHTWEFFVSLHIALFGAIFIAEAKITWRERLMIIPLYIGVVYLNYRSQLDNYTNAKKLIATAARLEEEIGLPLAERMSSTYQAGWLIDYLDEMYLICAGVTFFIVFVLQIGQKRR